MSLPLRWTPLRPHAEQIAYFESPHRFNVVPAGRRSGKTELAKRKLIMRALYGSEFRKPRYFAAAPTRDQAKRIYWDDLCALMPPKDVKDIRATDLLIRLKTGAEIVIVGMDRPERIEGSPWDGGILDEFANMKPNAWQANIRPALADRNGWCDLIGVPEGRNHYFDTYQRAISSMETFGAASEWGAYTWKSATVLSAHEIASAKADLDERTFRQEYEASFETYSGVVIYAFDRALSVKPCPMRSGIPLHVGMDFNVNPMSATVWQEEGEITRQVGEIVIPTSNTDDMCDELARRYSINGSVGHITVYPDPAGVQRRTSAQGRTDISILRDRKFGVRAMSNHPLVRDRINITNSRFCTVDGTRRAFVDPSCRKSIECYEKLSYREGTSEPDKASGFDHICFAAGTLVDTPNGLTPIEALPSQGMVMGWRGKYVPYVGAGMTQRNARLVSVEFDDGTTIRCTAEHLFLTPDGWVKACNLLNRVSSSGLQAVSEMGECGSRKYRVRRDHFAEPSTTYVENISSRIEFDCIGVFGNTISDLSQRVCTFITKMAIDQTTILRIWTFSQLESIAVSTCWSQNAERFQAQTCTLPLRQLEGGILPKLVSSGIVSTTLGWLKSCTKRFLVFASSAAQNLLGLITERPLCSVPTSVKQKRALRAASIMSKGPAFFAGTFFQSTATSRMHVARALAEQNRGGRNVVRVSPVDGEEPVYCLTVPGDGCFALAGGSIVSNCDATGYYLYTRWGIGPSSVSPLRL